MVKQLIGVKYGVAFPFSVAVLFDIQVFKLGQPAHITDFL